MKDKAKNIKAFIAIFISIIIIVILACYQFNNKNNAYTASYTPNNEKYDNVVENVEEGLEIGQSFIAKDNNLEKIYINFNNLKSKTTGGNALIGLRDSKGNIIKEEKIPYNYIKNNSRYEFSFTKQQDSKDQYYYLYIKFLDLEEEYTQYFSINYSSEDVYEDGSMYLNQMKMDGDINFQELYYNQGAVLIFVIIMAIIVIILGLLIYAVYKDKKLTPQRLFLYLIPIIMLMFLELMPTFKSHDEIFHWLRAYDITQGHFFTEMVDGKPRATFPEEVCEIGTFKSNTNINYADLKKQIKEQITEDGNKTIITLSTTAIYHPMQYIPQAFGIWISKLFTNKPIIMAYMARIMNMLITAVILYFALKNMPFGKKILLILICLPISIESFTSMSSDGITNAVAFFFTAYVLKLFNEKDKKLSIKNKVILLISAIVIALCKIVYLPIVGLLLILPKNKFKNRKDKTATIGIIMGIAIIANITWLVISMSYLATYKNGNSAYQIMNILTNPIEYLQTLFNTINMYGGNYLYSLFGGEIGWNEHVKLYSIVPIVLGGLYTFFAVTDEEIKNKFSTYQKTIIILILIAIAGLIFTSLYIQWTPLFTYDYILGVQGRYFIPIMPLLALGVLNNFKVKNEYTEETKLKVIGISILVIYIFVFLTLTNINS